MHTSGQSLENGFRVSTYSFPQLQTVAISFGVRYGSIDEKARINGSAHFLEHMMFKGTAKRTWKQLDDQIKELGIQYNAFTDHESTIYFMQVYKGYFEKAMEILSDMIRHSTLPEKEFELERGPIINENLIHHDNPRYMISDYIPKVLYRNHPAKMSVGGDNETTIKNVKRNDLLEIYDKYYTPKNSVFAIYGGVSDQKALAVAKKYFGDFERDYIKPKREIAREKQQRKAITIVRKGIQQTRIGIGFICGEFKNSDIDEFLSLNVVERYLSDKLFEEIREKNGLSYDPMASYNPYSTFGFIAAAAGIEPKNLEKTKGIMLDQFKKLQDGEIEKDELERTKKALSIEARTSRESTTAMSISMSIFNLMYGGTGILDSMPELISKVTMDDVRKYSSKYIDIDKYGMVLLKPA
jgi:predicted Zn-dependent peptidase